MLGVRSKRRGGRHCALIQDVPILTVDQVHSEQLVLTDRELSDFEKIAS